MITSYTSLRVDCRIAGGVLREESLLFSLSTKATNAPSRRYSMRVRNITNWSKIINLVTNFYTKKKKKNCPLGTFSSRVSLASLSAPRAHDSIVALRARSCALRIHLSLFLIIWYWSSNQFYNNITFSSMMRM